uniref:RlpA-like protein double-psi beta-barrel domain-containing protein n=1 Tax=Ditylenchus dipsaci TaxID=166011 RepID=A0A915D2S8_9BILA
MSIFLAIALLTTVFCCLVSAQLDAILNVPQTNSNFTFYGGAGRGACGLDYDATINAISAAGSGQLFVPNEKWVPSTLPDGRYVLDDPICRGICAKVEYNGKSIIVPINNKCPECSVKHIDLSQGAFAYLEPKLGEVGIGRNATITYMKCNSTTSATTQVRATTRAAASTARAATTVRSAAATTKAASSGSSGKLTGSVNVLSTWNGACSSVLFSLALQPGQIVANFWNMDAGANANQYRLPSWINIAANGGQYSKEVKNFKKSESKQLKGKPNRQKAKPAGKKVSKAAPHHAKDTESQLIKVAAAQGYFEATVSEWF